MASRSTVVRRLLTPIAVAVAGLVAWRDPVLGLDSLPAQLDWLRWTAVAGLLVLSQQWLRRAGTADFAAGAIMALSGTLSVGLAAGVGPAAALAAAAAVGLALTGSCLQAATFCRTRYLWVSLVLPVVVPAALPADTFAVAPDGIAAFAMGTLGLWCPWVLAVYVALALLTLAAAAGALAPVRQLVEPAAREPVAVLAAALVWSLLGVQLAGMAGPPERVWLWPAALGLGAAWWLAEDAVLWELVGGAATAAGFGLAVTWEQSHRALGGGGSATAAASLVAAGLLLLGLARRGLTDTGHFDAEGIDGLVAGIDHADGDRSPFARADGADGDGAPDH